MEAQTIMSKPKNIEENTINLLRICTFLLAVVSFWATASGMAEYTFAEKWQAYAASLGIQGLLLGLNFSLPTFLRKCGDNKKQKYVLYALTVVVLFCSSWFSYLFIAGRAYGDSWLTESRLLAQAIYRKELFAANDYAEQYGDELEQVLAEQVVELYKQAQNMDINNISVTENINWNEERNTYAAEGSATRNIMLTAIQAMEQATVENAAQDVRNQAVSILSDLQANLQSEIASLDLQVEAAATSVAAAETSLSNAQNRLNNAPSNVDITPYQNAVNQASQNFERSITRQRELEKRRDEYNNTLQRVSYYALTLGMNQEGVSSYFVGNNLREIQRELFTSEPDYERMVNLATNVFERLQTDVDLSSDNNVTYQSFLSDMNRFVKNIDNYRLIKEADNELQKFILDLADGNILNINGEVNEIDKNTDNNIQDNYWQNDWLVEFNDLKAKISGLPVYTLSGQVNGNSIARSFDRNDSTARLDKAIRNYLTEHNAAQQGLIYLFSPYRGIALFSLFLAFLLDIAAFVTGVIIDRIENEKRNKKDDDVDKDKEETDDEERGFISVLHNWSSKNNKVIVPTLNHYVFFTGDYSYIDGTRSYKTIENGEENEVDLDIDLLPGIYMFVNNQYIVPKNSKLKFAPESGGPQDGIIENCILSYENGFIIKKQNNNVESVTQVDSDITVYRLSEQQYDIIDIRRIKDIKCQKVIIALSKDGLKVVAVYLIIENNSNIAGGTI